MQGSSGDKVEISERAVTVRCPRDAEQPDRTCYASVLVRGGAVLDVKSNGCEDMDGSTACADCREAVKARTAREE